MPFESNVGTFGAESAAGSLAALNRPASCKPCPGAARMSAPPPGCSSPPLLPPGEPAGVRPPCTSIAPPISSTSSLCTAAGGPVCNRQMSATTHPHGPLFNGSEISYPPQNQEPSPTRRGLLRNPIRYWVGRPVFSRQVSLPDRAWADHITRVKVMVKVLDFIQLGGKGQNTASVFAAQPAGHCPAAPVSRSHRLRFSLPMKSLEGTSSGYHAGLSPGIGRFTPSDIRKGCRLPLRGLQIEPGRPS